MNYVPEVGDTVTISMTPVTGEVAYTDPVMREIRVGENYYYKLDQFNVELVKKKAEPVTVGTKLTGLQNEPPAGTLATKYLKTRIRTKDGWLLVTGEDFATVIDWCAMSSAGYTVAYLPSE